MVKVILPRWKKFFYLGGKSSLSFTFCLLLFRIVLNVFSLFCFKLFDEVTNDQVKGLNDEALILLTKFYRNGVQQSETSVCSEDVVENYHQSLPVQEVDPKRCY